MCAGDLRAGGLWVCFGAECKLLLLHYWQVYLLADLSFHNNTHIMLGMPCSRRYQGDKLSVWVLQGLAGAMESELASHSSQGHASTAQGLSEQQAAACAQALRQVLAEVANAAAYHSLVMGELPSLGAQVRARSCDMHGVVPRVAQEQAGLDAAPLLCAA